MDLYAPILTSPWFLLWLGLCVGSFLNVVIYRLPVILEAGWRADSLEILGVETKPQDHPQTPGMSLARPASKCPHCGHQIRWHENIPLVSWLMLRGKCSECKAPISMRYPLIELATGVLFAATAWHLSSLPGGAASVWTVLAWCGFMAALVALAGIDWDTTLLPDNITLPLVWAGLLAALLGLTIPLASAVTGAIAGYLALWSVMNAFKLATGKIGMGEGDFKLAAALGAWLGWDMLLPIFLVAAVVGAVIGIGMKALASLREGRYVPFGPFLALGAVAVFFIGRERTLQLLGWA